MEQLLVLKSSPTNSTAILKTVVIFMSFFLFWQDISDINVQFPSLAQDINIPKLYPEDRFFSSVFRISSAQGQLWTHYDVSTEVHPLYGQCCGLIDSLRNSPNIIPLISL